MLRTKIMAAAVGLGLAVMAPVMASAVTLSSTNNINVGGSYDLLAGPYFFHADYSNADVAGVYDFIFTNSSATDQHTAVSIGTVLQSTLKFLGGVTVTWLTGGNTTTVPEGTVGTFTLDTLIGAGGSDTLRVAFGDPTTTIPNGRGSVDLTVAAVPLPAGGLLLVGALGGIAALRRRKSV